MIRKFTLILSLFVAVISNIQAQNNNYKIQSAPNSGVFIESTKPVSDPSNGIDTIRISSSNRSIAKYVVASQHERVAYTVTQKEPVYRYESKPIHYVSDVAFGLYYSNESFLDPISWDSLRYRNSDSRFVPGFQMNKVSGVGFHFIFGGRKFIPRTQLGSFNWGFGMDFNHFKNGPKSEVVFNNDSEDKGFTRLETSAFNFHGMARFEKRVGPIYPFAAVRFGFNLYSTHQYIESYRASAEYESTNSNNLSTSVTPFISYELGLRARINSGLSFFASYENRSGNQLEVVNLGNSSFDGFTYKNDVRAVDYRVGNIKYGILINFSAAEREKILVLPARSDTTYTTNLVIFDTVWLEEPQYREETISVRDSRLKSYYLTKCKTCYCDTLKNSKNNNSKVLTQPIQNTGQINPTTSNPYNSNSELKSAPVKTSTPTGSNSGINSSSNTGSSSSSNNSTINADRSTPSTPTWNRPSSPSSTTPQKSSGTKAFPGIKPPPTTIKKPKA